MAVATSVTYATLGAALIATRSTGLDRSLWHDEIVTVRDFVREGPRQILSAGYLPNNHELFSFLAWATTSVAGESELVLRLWSVAPFIAGALLVTTWLHVRVGALSAALYLFFVTLSPLLLDLSRQARGYGLAFLAMSVLLVAALEARPRGRVRDLVAVAVAGFVGTATLPIFSIAYLATAAVLAVDRGLRSAVVATTLASVGAVAIWYAPNAASILSSSRQEYGSTIGTLELLVSPVSQILLPGLTALGGDTPIVDPAWLILVVVVLIPISASPLLRNREMAAIVVAPVLATVLALCVSQTNSVPRFVSYLLVPLFALLATGTASTLSGRHRIWRLYRPAAAVGVLCLATMTFAAYVIDVLRLPREAWADAAVLVGAAQPPVGRTLVYALDPGDFAYYAEAPVTADRTVNASRRACTSDVRVAVVVSEWRLPAFAPPCQERPGVRRLQAEQYARGGRIDVWFIPPVP